MSVCVCVCVFTVQAAIDVPRVQSNHSLSDKLRYAASCGQVDYLRQLLATGVASFDPDVVSVV